MADDKNANLQDEEKELFEGESGALDEQDTTGAAVQASGQTPPAPAREAEPNRAAIAAEILADKDLTPEDFALAQADPEHLSKLVDERIEEMKGKVAEGEKAGERASDTEAQAKRKPRRGYQRKIERLNERVLELEAALSGRAEKPPAGTERRPPATQEGAGTEAALKAAVEPEPKESQFDNLEGFEKAHRQWEITETASRIVESRLAAERAASEATRREQARQRGQAQAQARRTEQFESGRKAHPDFDDVLAEADDILITDPMDYAILKAPNGGEIIYWIGSNPEEAKRIANLPPDDAYLETRLIGARLESQTAAKTNGENGPKERLHEGSKTPPPPKTLGGRNARTGKTVETWANPDITSPDEFRRAVMEKKI